MIVGVDPGYNGGICFLDETAEVFRVPLLKQKKHEYDTVAICELLASVEPSVLIIEQVTRPASLTRCMGLFEGIGLALGYEVGLVRPQVWKAALGLTRDKQMSIELARELWPELRKRVKRKNDDGLAEAALIAYYWREYEV